MEDPEKLIESLLESATEYGKTSIELTKLKIVDKTSDVASSFLSHSIVIVIIAFFMLFLSLGLTIWLSKILGDDYFGFFAVSAFYGFAALIYYFLIHKWVKIAICNSLIKQMLK